MRRIGLLVVTLAGLLFPGRIYPPRKIAAQITTDPVVVETNERGIILTWTPADYQVAAIDVDGTTFSQIQMPNLALSADPGYPQLPFYSGIVGLPAAGDAHLQVRQIEWKAVQLPHLPLPSPVSQPVHFSTLDPADNAFFGGPKVIEPDLTRYTLNAFYPDRVAHLGVPQQVRNWRTASLTINPVRVNPVTRQMEVIRFVQLEISFEQPAVPSLSKQSKSNPFAQALLSALINPEAVQWFSEISVAAQAKQSAIETADVDNLTKVVVSGAGLYQLTYNNLQTAGFSMASLDPRKLQISYGASFQPVAILVEGEADGSFDPDDRILFYAEPTFSRYSNQDVYFVGVSQTTPPRMQHRSGNPQGLPAGTAWRTSKAEVNSVYESLHAGRDGDYWYWGNSLKQSCYIQGSVSKNYTIAVDNPLVSAAIPATLTVWLQGASDNAPEPDHKAQVHFNSEFVGQHAWSESETAWNGTIPTAPTLTALVPGNKLQNGNNQIKITLPGLDDGDGVCESGEVVTEDTLVDAFSLLYPTQSGGTEQLQFVGETGKKSYTLTGWTSSNLLLFNITTPLTPSQVVDYRLTASGNQYNLVVGDADTARAKYLVVPENKIKSPLKLEAVTLLNTPPNGADYIIITHPDFADAVKPLANYRAGQGLRVVTVDVGDIYNTFGGGRVLPQAIKDFLRHAYESWSQPQPLYVLLVGDGTYDFKNHSGFNPENFIPPYLAYVDPWLGETASDNRLVSFDVDNNFPEMMIGRLPVNSVAETTTVVNKIIQYETNPVPGGWNVRHLFVGDDIGISYFPQIFHMHADQAYNRLDDPLEGYRFYYRPDSSTADYIYANAETLRNNFLAYFNAGAGIITFHGHSSWHQWALEALFRWSLVSADNDVIHLKNHNRLPVVLGMTCFTGFFHHPEYPTMDESLLRRPGGGAVAVWGATGLGVATGHESLQEGFYNALLDNGETNLGAAIWAGKLKLTTARDLLDTFTLFGDPALNLNFTIVPFSEHLYLPIIERQDR